MVKGRGVRKSQKGARENETLSGKGGGGGGGGGGPGGRMGGGAESDGGKKEGDARIPPRERSGGNKWEALGALTARNQNRSRWVRT